MIRLLFLLLASVMAACSSTPPPRQPEAVELAQTLDKDARRALRNGELQRAHNTFSNVLVLQQSVDDSAAAATTMINLATVTHQLNKDMGALIWLDKILLEKDSIYPPESRLIAAFRKAVILTNMARLDEAEKALQNAAKLCDKNCNLFYGISMLRARLLMAKGDAQAALAIAEEVSREKQAGKEEQTNALRLMAAAEEKLQRYAEALKHYQAALDNDKALGISARIAEDLNGLVRVSKLLGRTDEAIIYARRAAIVSNSLKQRVQAARE
ncbi:MAG: tetratricopeptide repeat protein [Gallionellaceae bacterium]|jgi:tetratricopeptide (TPR) repeat protein